jgi:predicted DNA-binding protein (MmcQ/YjbR family)
MEFNQLHDFCMSLPYAEETFPFDQDTLVFKVGGKAFALTSLKVWEEGAARINLKCVPERSIELREQYAAIEPGYHMNKTHWNTVTINQDVNDILLKELINHSYQLVFNSLSSKLKKELLGED